MEIPKGISRGVFLLYRNPGAGSRHLFLRLPLFVFTNQGLRMKNVYAEKIHSKNKKGGTRGSGNAAVNGRVAAGSAADFYGKGDFLK